MSAIDHYGIVLAEQCISSYASEDWWENNAIWNTEFNEEEMMKVIDVALESAVFPSSLFWLYTSRRGETMLFPGTRNGFDRARGHQDDDNRCTLEDILEDGELEISGSFESGSFSIDDGGSIRLMSVE